MVVHNLHCMQAQIHGELGPATTVKIKKRERIKRKRE
jgi:hypothetical protein